MATYKITFIFGADKQGWSELWYVDANDIQTAGLRGLEVASSRKGLLGTGSVLEAIRVSDEAIRNDSLIQLTPPVAAGPGVGNAIRDTPGNAWLCRIQAGALYRRQLWLRGIPDSWIVWDQTLRKYEIPAILQARFDAFRDALVAKTFRIRATEKSPTVNPLKPITAIAADPSGVWKMTSPVHGLANQDYVRISGTKGSNVKQFRGIWQIFGVTADTFFIPLVVVPTSPVWYIGGGMVQRRTTSYKVIDGGTLLRPALRRTGRAFFVPAGRRPVKR